MSVVEVHQLQLKTYDRCQAFSLLKYGEELNGNLGQLKPTLWKRFSELKQVHAGIKPAYQASPCLTLQKGEDGLA